jgi:hypothetical protein
MLLVFNSSLQLQHTPPTNLLETVSLGYVPGLASVVAGHMRASSSNLMQRPNVATTTGLSSCILASLTYVPTGLSPAQPLEPTASTACDAPPGGSSSVIVPMIGTHSSTSGDATPGASSLGLVLMCGTSPLCHDFALNGSSLNLVPRSSTPGDNQQLPT